MVFFFFSSRRRHTRCLSDWSSDVCSSDLHGTKRSVQRVQYLVPGFGLHADVEAPGLEVRRRSEERRVGKECRSRWAPDPERKRKEADDATARVPNDRDWSAHEDMQDDLLI